MSLDSIYQRSPAWVQTILLNAYAVGISRYRRGRRLGAVMEQVMASQSWPHEKMAEYQDAHLRKVVQVAYERSAYYRQLMDARGITPSRIRGRVDLVQLPLITKEILRERLADVLTAPLPLRDWRHGHTSGTTGSPLSLWYDREMSVFNDAMDARQKRWAGMTDHDWIAVLLGRVIVPTTRQTPPFWRVNRVHRQVWFSSFHLSPEHLETYVAELRRRQIRFLEGYPSTVFILAQYLTANGLTLPMKAVFTSSETLHQVQRETIRAAFSCEPTDFYGHAERVIFATECEEHDGKHIAEEYGYVEVVDDHGERVPDGEHGYLVGTTLHNLAMPLLRYRTGDISAIRRDPCSCGRTLARIENVATKAEDIVITPDGRMISPSVLTHPFKPFHQILKSQLIQDRIDHVTVNIVPSHEFTDDHQRQLKSEIEKRLGKGIVVDIVRLADIPREKSGKFRWIISLVEHRSHFAWQ